MTFKKLGTTFLTTSLLATIMAHKSDAVVVPDADAAAMTNAISSSPRGSSSDVVRIIDVTQITTELQNAVFGTATLSSTAGSFTFWDIDTSTNTGYAMSAVGNAWRTFSLASMTGPWNATTTLTLTETTRNGASSPASPYTIALTLTKTGTPADITQTMLRNFLRGSTISAIVATGSGTALTSTSALASGWAATVLLKDGTAANTAGSLLQLEGLVNLPITLSNNIALNLRASLKNLQSFNVATSATTEQNINFTVSEPAYASTALTIAHKSGPSARTVVAGGPAAVFVSALSAFNSRNLNTTANQLGLTPKLTDLEPLLRNALSGGSTPLYTELTSIMASLLASPNTTFADITTQGGTAAPGTYSTTHAFVGLGSTVGTSSAISNITWALTGTKLIATGTPPGGAAKEYTLDLNGKTVINASTNPVLAFSAPDGDTFWLVSTAAAAATNDLNFSTLLEGDQALTIKLYEIVTDLDATSSAAPVTSIGVTNIKTFLPFSL